MPTHRGTLTAFDPTTGLATCRLDGSSPVTLTSVRASHAISQATLIAGRRLIIDTGDHGDPADAVITALYNPASAAFPGDPVMPTDQTPRYRIIPDLARYPIASRYEIAEPTANPWLTANTAYYVPFEIDEAATIVNVLLTIVTQSGNYDLAIYNAALTRLWSKGAGAVPAAGAVTVSCGTLALAKGRYYFATVFDNTTASMQRFLGGSGSTPNAQLWGLRQQAAAYPLPNPAVPANPANVYIPLTALEFQ